MNSPQPRQTRNKLSSSSTINQAEKTNDRKPHCHKPKKRIGLLSSNQAGAFL
ncbi:hypothetical protein OIU79_004414 [Salix purpurea]|uniref:Uncharacterized protein n=1 Tax=Salix purpurea TaxID=77065 RepID=A0A9Q0UA27_SALPP|nr:hypothetical protein OIU79_004414 [Salix purpurea]